MKINEELNELYSRKWDALENDSRLISNITHPLLIQVDEAEFCDSNIKIMIFGQETDDWCGDFPIGGSPLSVWKLMDVYQKYHESESKGKNRISFFNRRNFKYFEEELSKYFEIKGEKSIFLWNNLSKIGKTSRGEATEKIREVELNYLNVIRKELKILKPDIIIFSTGCSRDKYINEVFGKKNVEFEYPDLSFGSLASSYEIKSIIAKVNLKEFPDILCIRVEHPNRRTLDNSVIINVIKGCWESKSK